MGELRPVDEQLIESRLVEAQEQRRLEGCHRGGARRGDEHGELPDRGPRAELDDRASATMHADPSLDDGEEVGFDGAFLDQHLARLETPFDGDLGNGCEHATGDPGEQLHSMQRGDALDEAERRRLHAPIGHVEDRNPDSYGKPHRDRDQARTEGQAEFASPRAPVRCGGTTPVPYTPRVAETADAPTPTAIDGYLPEDVRQALEERFWRAIEGGATLEAVADDEAFLSASDSHPALFSDHGIVHARDVAAGAVELADVVDGRLLPARPPDRRQFVAALAVLIAYLHDVGMSDATPDGRRVHPIYAAQVPFSGAMDDVVARLVELGGPIVSRIDAVAAGAPFAVPNDVVLRELAALAVGHSKSTVPSHLLGDVASLRGVMQHGVLVDLDRHRRDGGRLSAGGARSRPIGDNARWYTDPLQDAFAWLDSPDPSHVALADDALDALRLVRVADALRQRGTTLRTSAGYEIFVDVETGLAVFSLRTGDRQLLLRVRSALSAGEANVRAAVLTRSGDLRIAFHRGRFSTPEAGRVASEATARVVADIAADVLGAFSARRCSHDLRAPARDPRSMRVELERPTDEPAFAEAVANGAALLDGALRGRLFVVADLESTSPVERSRYLAGVAIDGDSDEARTILDALASRGMRIAEIDRSRAFEDVRRVAVDAGEVLIEAGSPPAFVYVPVGCRLRIDQLGGYSELEAPPWIPIGVTGVVRRAERNATVAATKAGDVLMIPGELFAREWFRPYEPDQLGAVIRDISGR